MGAPETNCSGTGDSLAVIDVVLGTKREQTLDHQRRPPGLKPLVPIKAAEFIFQ